MARDIEAAVKVKDESGPGLSSVEKRFRDTGQKITKEYERFGTGAGNGLLAGIGSVSPKLANKIASSLGDGARLGAPLLLSGLAPALPLLSGLVGSAVTGGAAGAGIIGGVALAMQDSRVKEAGKQLGNNLLGGLRDRATSFIGPVLNSIDIIEQKFLESGDTIESIFEGSSRFVEPLADALGEAAQGLLEGVETAVGRAGPVMDALADGIEQTGETIGQLIDMLSENADGNAAILRATFDGLNSILVVTGGSLKLITDGLEAINSVVPLSILTTNGLAQGLLATDDAGRRSQGGTFGAATGFQIAGDAAATAEKDTKLYEQALKDNEAAARTAADAQRSLFDDTTRVGEAMSQAREAAQKNGRTLDANTEKGRANRAALSSLAGALNGYRGNLEKSGASADQVNRVMGNQRSRLIAVANSMGITGGRARALADQLLGIKSRNVTVTANTASAAANARNVRQEIAQIRSRSVTVTVNVNASRLAAVENRLARLQRGGYFAAGADSFGETTPGQTARTGGPITVENSLSLSIDGTPFRSYTLRTIDQQRRRTAFENKVGHRGNY